MSDENTETALDNASEQAESVKAGESAEQASQAGESTAAESPVLYDNMTAEQLHSSYKELQGKFTPLSQSVKGLDRFGGIDGLNERLDGLLGNPRFMEFVESEKRRNAYGIDESEMEPDQKSALNTVETIAKQVASDMRSQLMEEFITPLQTSIKERSLEESFSAMDKKHPGWRDLQDVMGDLAEKLSPEVYGNPTLEDVEMLHTLALHQSGKFDDYAANVYKQMLEQKKASDTGKPAPHAGEGEPGRATSIQQAWAMAKKAQA